eukprot:jgi/Picsp_1/3674/NSC_06511-R1_lipase class 3 family protein
MATTTFAAAGTVLALYYYSKRQCRVGEGEHGFRTHETAYRAPKSFFEDLYFFAEGLRYTYGETIYKWRTADLLIGLAYLCSKEPDPTDHPLSDIGRYGQVYGRGLSFKQKEKSLALLDVLERSFRYCSGLRERRPVFQRRYMMEVMDVQEADILRQEVRAGVLKPSFVLIQDRKLNAIVLAIRGTHSFKDAFTSLTGASKPHHVVDSNGVTLGYSHFGMLAAARWMKSEIVNDLETALEENPGMRLLIIGHSLGGGTAAMLTMMLREQGGAFGKAECISIACPACMTLELAESCRNYVTTVINNCDVIPTISPGSADGLREEVTRSSWYSDFRRDMRSSRFFRAVESGIRGVGTATSWTTTRLASCYQRKGTDSQHKRRNSDSLRGSGDRKKYDKFDSVYGDASMPKSSASATDHSSVSTGGSNSTGFSRLSNFVFSTASYMTSWGANTKQDDFASHASELHDDRQKSTSFVRDGMQSLNIDDGPDSLRAEASFRMRAVKNAVLDAEEEEKRPHGNENHLGDAVPSVIRPGNYGDGSGMSSRNDQSWKRMMYPAGRIMHFVPASVVQGEDYDFQGDYFEGFETNIGVSEVVAHSRNISELSVSDFMGAEEAAGSASVVDGAHREPLPPLKPAPGPAPRNMILLDGIPQRAYGRIKLCTSVLSDHVIPNYLRSLDSFRKLINWRGLE